MFQWAIERSGVSPTDLERRFPRLRQWRVGEALPTLRQLEAFARATSTPFGYLFLSEPPIEKLPIPHFRTLGDEEPTQRPTPDLLETVQLMERRQAWMRDFLIDQGQDPMPFVRSAQIDDDSHEFAGRIRHTLGLADDWAEERPSWTDALRHLQEAMDQAGILVVVNGIVGNNTHRRLKPAEFRGFVLVDEYAPLVFVNGADGKAAQMFTLAHELAHVWLGSSAAFDLRELQPANDRTERACNRVAAEFLVPELKLREVWVSIRREPEPFQAIARVFKVSAIVGARRALDVGLVTKPEFLGFYQAYQDDERRSAARRSEGGNFYATQRLRIGRRFGDAVVRAAGEGRLLFTEAYQLTGLYGRAFERYAARLGYARRRG